MHMPKQTWTTPVSLLPAGERRRLMRESFDRHFPWLAEKEQVSAPKATELDSSQRGFLIGSVRL